VSAEDFMSQFDWITLLPVRRTDENGNVIGGPFQRYVQSVHAQVKRPDTAGVVPLALTAAVVVPELRGLRGELSFAVRRGERVLTQLHLGEPDIAQPSAHGVTTPVIRATNIQTMMREVDEIVRAAVKRNEITAMQAAELFGYYGAPRQNPPSFLVEVAATYAADPPNGIATIRQRWPCDEKTAGRWVTHARDAQYLTPTRRGVASGELTAWGRRVREECQGTTHP
jgi:hypothetical protein